ncbi:MAG: zinc ABC transporter substrate-binding protein [Chlamydiales bacterium]|nr:zinc ABC transporter substrate-binding protein [Chlamydiales bacterium]
MRKCLVALLLILAGCAQNPSREAAWFQQKGKLKVLATIAMIHNLVEEVGGEYVVSIPLIRGELDPHSYELVKGDDEKFATADLIFYNGLGLEHGLSLRQNLEGNPKAVAVADPLLEKSPRSILIVDGQYDPHVWMDIVLWMQAVDPIVEALCEKDPPHAAYYRTRGDSLRETMQQADAEISARLQGVPPEKRYLVTSHDAFNYFTRRYLAQQGEEDWMVRCEAPEGLAPEAQMSVSDVLAIIAHIEQYRISVLFPESNVSRDALRKIVSAAKEKGLPIRLCPDTLYGDSMGDSASYLEMIRHNAAVIATELEK